MSGEIFLISSWWLMEHFVFSGCCSRIFKSFFEVFHEIESSHLTFFFLYFFHFFLKALHKRHKTANMQLNLLRSLSSSYCTACFPWRFAILSFFQMFPCFVPLKLSALGKVLLNLKVVLFFLRLKNVSDID